MIQINVKDFTESLDELEARNGVSREIILNALKEAMEKGYKKTLGGDDAVVRVDINLDKGYIDIGQEKTVVEDPENEFDVDDFLYIPLSEAKKINKDAKVGDTIFFGANKDEISKATVLSIKSVYKQKLSDAEKVALYEAYKDKVGDMITGKVEKVEENGLSVNVGKTSLYITKKDLIGDERFKAGDSIKLYVASVSDNTKGAKIVVTRSNPDFLKKIFEEEIREIYDGTIIIKGIAREAGERSKVSVYTNDPNVDPSGACIGPNGSRIQKIVTQLGNGNNKEKIDVITYSESHGLYIVDALKPAVVLGANIDEENKKATAIVGDGSLSLAIGRKGVNVRLASKLTGYSIDIKEASTALEEGITYTSVEELERLDIEEKQAKAALEAQRRAEALKKNDSLNTLPDGYVAPSKRHYEDEISDEDKERLLETIENEEEKEAPVKEEFFKEETPLEVKEEKVEEIKSEPKKVEEVKKTEVKTTTTLEDLEKELASEAQKAKANQNKSRKKKKDDEVKEDSHVTTVDPSQRMSIYTDEELAEFEEEEEINDEYEDEDIDEYDEYEDYYDDDDK